MAARSGDWPAREAALLSGAVEPGDTVFGCGRVLPDTIISLAARAGWVFASAVDDAHLTALRSAFETVKPENLTYGSHAVLLDWCPGADVVVAADWTPTSADPEAELASLLAMADRALIVTGWRGRRSAGCDGPANNLERVLSFAGQRGLEARIVGTPVDPEHERTLLMVRCR